MLSDGAVEVFGLLEERGLGFAAAAHFLLEPRIGPLEFARAVADPSLEVPVGFTDLPALGGRPVIVRGLFALCAFAAAILGIIHGLESGG